MIAGEKVVGGKIAITLQVPNGSKMSFKPQILKYETSKEFRWKGVFGVKGIFDGEHYFILEKAGENRTKFIHGELFIGILVGMMSSTLIKIQEGFKLMNIALKNECWSGPPNHSIIY
jgi:hypothetical protein